MQFTFSSTITKVKSLTFFVSFFSFFYPFSFLPFLSLSFSHSQVVLDEIDDK